MFGRNRANDCMWKTKSEDVKVCFMCNISLTFLSDSFRLFDTIYGGIPLNMLEITLTLSSFSSIISSDRYVSSDGVPMEHFLFAWWVVVLLV